MHSGVILVLHDSSGVTVGTGPRDDALVVEEATEEEERARDEAPAVEAALEDDVAVASEAVVEGTALLED